MRALVLAISTLSASLTSGLRRQSRQSKTLEVQAPSEEFPILADADLESCPSIAGKYKSHATYVNDYVAANFTFEQNGCEVVQKDGRGVPMSSFLMKPNTKQTEYLPTGTLVPFGNSTFQRSCSIYGTWPASRVLCGAGKDYSQCRDISGEYTWGDKTVTLTQDHCSGLMTPADGSPSARFNMTQGDTFDDVTFTYEGKRYRQCLAGDGGFERCERDGGFFQGTIGLPQTMDGQVLPPRLSIKTSGLDRPSDVRPVFNIRFGPTPFDKNNLWPKGNLLPLGATPRQLCNNREPATLGGDCVCPERQVCSQKGGGMHGTPYGCPSGGDSPPYLWQRLYRHDCGEECKCVQPTCSSSSRCSNGYFTGSTKNRFSLPLKGYTKEDVGCFSGRSRKQECIGEDKKLRSEPYKMCFYCVYVKPVHDDYDYV